VRDPRIDLLRSLVEARRTELAAAFQASDPASREVLPTKGGWSFDASVFSRHLEMPAFLDRSRKLKLSQPSGSVSADEAWDALRSSRRALFDALDGSAGLRLEDFSREHPAGGTLDGHQWVAFVGLHESRHAAQVAEIQSQLLRRGS